MKGLTIGLGVLAVLALGAGNSAADGFVSMPPPTVDNGVYNSDGYIMVDNWDNGGGGAGTGTNFNSPYATTDGALWIVTGGVPVQVSQDVNMTLYWRADSSAAWTTITTILLDDQNDTSNGAGGPYAHASGYTDVTSSIPPNGYFLDPSGATGWGTRPAHSSYEIGAGGYYLPDSASLNGDFSQSQFRIQCWTGSATSYPGSAGPGQEVADSGAFAAGYVHIAGDINPDFNNTFVYMPAVVLTMPGDANYDGKVDINDLTIVLAHYDQTSMTWADGEFTGDGRVDINDLTIVLANYGQGLGASAAGMAAVPEPSTIVIAAALLGLLVSCRRKPSRSRLPAGT